MRLFYHPCCGLFEDVHCKYECFESFVLGLTMVIAVIDLLGDYSETKETETKIKIKIID